jgi:hypothetical protein
MGYIDKGALLGASDLREQDVELPSIGATVRVRGLAAAFSNQAQSEALELVTDARGRQTATVNTDTLECLQVLHGLVEPKLASLDEARTFAQHCGPAFRVVVKVIDELSGLDKATIEAAEVRFPPSGPEEAGPVVGNGDGAGDERPDLHVRTGAGAGVDGG